MDLINAIDLYKNLLSGFTALRVYIEQNNTKLAVEDTFSAKSRVEVMPSVSIPSGIFTNVYSYTGSGLLIGFNIEFNSPLVIPRLTVDGENIFTGKSITDYNGLLSTNATNDKRQNGQGIVTSTGTLDFSLRRPIKFNSSIVISADGNAATRVFNQGIIYLTKET